MFMPSSIPSILHVLTHLIFLTTQEEYYYFPFNKEGSQATCPNSRSLYLAGSRWEPRYLEHKRQFFHCIKERMHSYPWSHCALTSCERLFWICPGTDSVCQPCCLHVVSLNSASFDVQCSSAGSSVGFPLYRADKKYLIVRPGSLQKRKNLQGASWILPAAPCQTTGGCSRAQGLQGNICLHPFSEPGL